MKRIKITERQKQVLANHILKESSDLERVIKLIVDDLNQNYEPIVGTYRKGGEYFEKPMVKIKADGEMITPNALWDYLKYKHQNIGGMVLKQIIIDWVNGDIKDYSLTKNVSIR